MIKFESWFEIKDLMLVNLIIKKSVDCKSTKVNKSKKSKSLVLQKLTA